MRCKAFSVSVVLCPFTAMQNIEFPTAVCLHTLSSKSLLRLRMVFRIRAMMRLITCDVFMNSVRKFGRVHSFFPFEILDRLLRDREN